MPRRANGYDGERVRGVHPHEGAADGHAAPRGAARDDRRGRAHAPLARQRQRQGHAVRGRVRVGADVLLLGARRAGTRRTPRSRAPQLMRRFAETHRCTKPIAVAKETNVKYLKPVVADSLVCPHSRSPFRRDRSRARRRRRTSSTRSARRSTSTARHVQASHTHAEGAAAQRWLPHTNGTPSHSTSAGAPWQRQPTHRRHRAGIVLSSTLTPQGSAVHAAELTGTYVAIVAKQ